MSDVEWRAIPGWEGMYEVSSDGRVRSLDRWGMQGTTRRWYRGRTLSATPNGRGSGAGYLTVSLKRRGHRTPMLIHRAVLLAFRGPRPPGGLGRHLNGDCQDNRPENLAWGTYSENARDTVRHGKNRQTLRDACPLGHVLAVPNLTTESQRRGNRSCLACSRAGGNAAYAKRKGRPFDVAEAAHRHYALIMKGSARAVAQDGTGQATSPTQGLTRVDAQLSRAETAPSCAPGGGGRLAG